MMLVLGFVERQFVLVSDIPGIRLGLSNTVLLYALCLMDTKSAWLLMLLKVLLGGFLFSIDSLWYSLSGGILSMIAMWLALFIGGMSMVGVSVSGATFHMVGQLLMASIRLGEWTAVAQAPWLLAAAVVTGVLTGVTAHVVCRSVARGDSEMQNRLENLGRSGRKKL